MPVECFVNAKCLTELCRSICKIHTRVWPEFIEHMLAFKGLNGSNEYGRARAFWPGNNIAAVMHAVGKVHIKISLFTPTGLGWELLIQWVFFRPDK